MYYSIKLPFDAEVAKKILNVIYWMLNDRFHDSTANIEVSFPDVLKHYFTEEGKKIIFPIRYLNIFQKYFDAKYNIPYARHYNPRFV